jgi:hypothetical protein
MSLPKVDSATTDLPVGQFTTIEYHPISNDDFLFKTKHFPLRFSCETLRHKILAKMVVHGAYAETHAIPFFFAQ